MAHNRVTRVLFLFSTLSVYPLTPVLAQEATLEEVLVTGSRIRTDPLERSAPVTTLNAEDIQRTGITSIADVLQRLPTSGGALNSKFNSSGNFGFPPDGGGIGAGAAQVDLRYLGSKRVLVLVDGVRWVSGSSASGVSSATDLNTIPSAIIERVEVLEDGASAIYGSDAIGGVVNIITKKDFDGFSMEAYSGIYDEGDGESQDYNLSWGTGDDDTRLFFSLSLTDQGSISANDRELASTPIPFVPDCGAGCSSGTPQGRFVLSDPNTGNDLDLTINDGVSGIPVYDPADPGGANDDFHNFESSDRFNFSPYNMLLAPVKRWGIFTQIEQKLSSNVNLRAKALYNTRESKNQAAPEPLFIGSDAGNGNLLDTISIDATNPYNPFGFTIDAASQAYFIGRRPLENGPRVFTQNVDTFYASLGFDGNFEFNSNTYYWDATVASSTNRATQVKHGGFNSAHLQTALGPLDVCEATLGCVPFNIFGGQGADGEGTITDEMLDYVAFVQKDQSEQELYDISLNLTGPIVELPAGPLSFAVGYEYREQKGYFQPDAVVVAGESAGVPSSPTSGEFETKEFYGEIDIPIFAEAPGAELLSFNAASRSVDYDTFGTETSNKFSLKWKPFSDLLLRASTGEGFRAPGIGELFGSTARFDQTLNDPCSDLANQGNQTVIDNCIALGVPGDGSYQQLNPQISVTTGGNRELQPETSKSKHWGIVYSPSWVDDIDWVESISFELNHYDIEIEDAIQAVDADVQLNLCVRTLDPTSCAGISRTSSGVINAFANQLTNIGGIETSGYDFTVDYQSPTTDLGFFHVSWTTSNLQEFIVSNPTSDGFQQVHREGTELGDPEAAYPEWKSTLKADWVLAQWYFAWTLRYIHEIEESCQGLADFPGLCSNTNLTDDGLSTNKLDATVYNDIQVTWNQEVTDGVISVTAGVNNLLDEDPPACFSCALNGFDATTYDVPGQFFYLRLNYKME